MWGAWLNDHFLGCLGHVDVSLYFSKDICKYATAAGLDTSPGNYFYGPTTHRVCANTPNVPLWRSTSFSFNATFGSPAAVRVSSTYDGGDHYCKILDGIQNLCTPG